MIEARITPRQLSTEIGRGPDFVSDMIHRRDLPDLGAVYGIAEALKYLHSSRRRIALATSAEISDENQIRGALARGELAEYFSHIYCFKNTNLPKSEEFYRHILSELDISASESLMIGDGFEKDVEIPNHLGIFAVWFNPGSEETRKGNLHSTAHSMQAVQEFFKSLDQE